MDADRWQRLSPLLDAMFELDVETRARSLELLRQEDPQLAEDLAALIALPLLVLVANALGVFGGYLLSVHKLGFNPVRYLEASRRILEPGDLGMRLVKAGVFGFFIALMGCYHGFRSTGGAAGVGAGAARRWVPTRPMLPAREALGPREPDGPS